MSGLQESVKDLYVQIFTKTAKRIRKGSLAQLASRGHKSERVYEQELSDDKRDGGAAQSKDKNRK